MPMTVMMTSDCSEFTVSESAPESAPRLRLCDADAPAERRNGLRVQQARPVRVYEPTGARSYGGRTEDVSVTGLRVELPASTPLYPGKIISVHVGLDHDGAALPNRRQLIPARVVWVDRTFTRGSALAGIEFVTSIAAHLDAA